MKTGSKGDGAYYQSEAQTPTLPLDLVEEILCWLPVKFLLQLCCVCKSWNSLISHDSKFHRKQLRFSASSGHGRRRLILAPVYSASEFLVFDFPISSIFSSMSTSSFVKQLTYPVMHKVSGGLSTRDGIFCFGIDESLALLFNPSIRKFKLLPPLKNPKLNYRRITSYTLVYDRFIDIYKILAVSYCEMTNERDVHINNLGTDYWRRIPDIPYRCRFAMLGIFVSDTVNWLIYEYHSRSRFIVSLDLEKESYQKLLLLHPLCDEQVGSNMVLQELRGCLSILSHSVNSSDIWIMKEYGNEQSWTKLLSVPYMKVREFFIYSKTIYISEDEQVLMEYLKRRKFGLVVYDSRNDTFKIPDIQYINDRMFPNIYFESLISSPFSHY